MIRTFSYGLIGLVLFSGFAIGQEQVGTTERLDAKPPVTFSSDIAQIMYEKCASCHRLGQVGPFSLLTYDDVKRHSSTIAAVVESGYMPPWKPVNDTVAYSNDRRLSSEEKQKLMSWIKNGAPAGNLEQSPAAPKFSDGWSLGQPDLVIKMNGQFEIPAQGRDINRSFVFPLDLPEDKWVKAIELRPKSKGAMHHALFFLDTTGEARKKDGSDGKAGIAGMGFLADFGGRASDNLPIGGGQKAGILARLRGRAPKDANSDNGRIDGALARGLGGYVPGAIPTKLPGDLAMALPNGADIVMQTHFHPTGKAEVEQAELALYFADRPPSKQLVTIQVPEMFGFGAGIDIPAGEKEFKISDSFTLPIDVQAISVGGHAHYICKSMSMTATTPLGTTISLMEINDWDLDWQDRYLFASPVDLPAGTVLETEIVYDNSADNPQNPFQPPQRIRWGRESNDEMGSVSLLVVAADESQRPELQAAVKQSFNRNIVNRFLLRDGFGKMLMQLDSNRDGLLQKSEVPPRLSGRVFNLLDEDKNGGLDENELSRLGQLAETVGQRTKADKE